MVRYVLSNHHGDAYPDVFKAGAAFAGYTGPRPQYVMDFFGLSGDQPPWPPGT